MEFMKSDDVVQTLKNTCQQMMQVLDTYEENADRCCLKEIQAVMKEITMDDFEVIEEIVCILKRYGWSVGTRHDFG